MEANIDFKNRINAFVQVWLVLYHKESKNE